jgi:hypothetical protein
LPTGRIDDGVLKFRDDGDEKPPVLAEKPQFRLSLETVTPFWKVNDNPYPFLL